MSIPAEASSRIDQALERFLSECARCRQQPGPEEVHDLRVSIRRFAQRLRLFELWVPKKQARKVRERTHGVLELAGAVRDCDIALELTDHLNIELPDESKQTVAGNREGAAANLLGAIESVIGSDFAARCRGRLQLADTGPEDSRAMANLAADRLPRMADDFIEAGGKLSDHPKSKRALHRFRISAKHFRYSLEPFGDCYGPALEKRIVPVRKIQTVLGDLNDCVATRRMLKELGLDKATLEPLREEEKKRLHEFQESWPKLFGDGASQNWRRFLEDAAAKPATPRRSPKRAGAKVIRKAAG